MPPDLALVAGAISTVIFMTSYVPMLVKAMRTRDLHSYSLSNLLLINLGNMVHSVYVFSLPIGPIWALHSMYLAAGALMIVWYLRFSRTRARAAPGRKHHRRE